MAVASVGFEAAAIGGNSGQAVYSTYGGVEYSSSMGSGLLIVGAYDLAPSTSAPLPFMTPCDSAGNLYLPLGQLPAGVTNASTGRLFAWICPNARPIKWASVSCGTIVSAEITGIFEFSGFPSWMQLSMTTLYAGGTGTSPSLSGPTSAASFCVGIVASSTVTSQTFSTPAGWSTTTPTNQVASGATNGITAEVFFQSTGSAGTVTFNPVLGVSAPYTIMLAAITLAPVAPVQVNASYPRFIYEAQFGRNLGDLSTAPYSPGPAVSANVMNVTPAALTFSDTYNTTVNGGQTLVAQITVPAPATITLTDSSGNSYTQIQATTIPGGTATTYIFEVLDCLGVTPSTTQYFTQSVSQTALVNTVSVPGVWQLDVNTVATGTSSTPSGSTGTLGSVMDYELFILTNNGNENSSASVAGFATVGQANQGTMYASIYGRVSTPGTGYGAFGAGDTLSTTFATSTGWVMNVLAFKAVQWVDISTYVRNGAMGQTMSSTQGRPYELSQPTAGSLDIRLDTNDGTFFPDNANSKFYPGVLAETPVRVTTVSNGRQYPVASGYVDQWPLSWPELPQWTFSQISATDTVEQLTNSNLPSGLQCEIRNDAPYAYFPGNEQYSAQLPSSSTYAAGLNDLRTSSECAGLQAVNAALYNQRNAYYSDGNAPGSMASDGTACQTGLAMPYSGTQDTGFGTSNYSTALSPTTTFYPHGPGLTYIDPVNMPVQSNVTTGVTLEWFCEVPGVGVAGTSVESVTLLECAVRPSNCLPVGNTSGNAITDLVVYTNNPSASVMEFFIRTPSKNGVAISAAYTPSVTIAGVLTPNLFHCVLNITGNTATFWLNGVAQTPVTGLGLQGGWTEIRLGGARGRWGQQAALWNYAVGHFALYNYTLPQSRIQSHYQMGAGTGLPQPAAGENISSYDYMAAALAYSRVPAQAAGPGTGYLPDVGQMGPMYSVSSSSAMDTANTAVNSEGGLIFIDKQCNSVILGRNATYNQASFVTFGDANNASMIPFLQDAGFGYDDQFLYTLASVQVETGSTEGVLAQAEDFGGNLTGQVQYGTRSAPPVTAQVQQANDGVDQVNWRLNKYNTPSIRAKQITVDAAALIGGAVDTALAATGGVVGTLLSCNIGTVVTMSRTPMGANATVSELGVIEQVEITAGPSLLTFQFIISPYNPEGDILQADNTAAGSSGTAVNKLGYGSLAW